MSYTYSNEIKYADTGDLDAFGRLRVSNVTSLLEIKHVYNNLPLLVDQKIGGTGNAVWSSTNSEVVMSVSTTGDYAIRQTKSRGIYQPGKGQIMEASFGNLELETDVIKRVGYFSSVTTAPYNSGFDGYFLESDGTSITFQIWQSGTLIHSSDSSTWFTTDYDFSLLDLTKTQLMITDFQWLGVGRVRFGMVVDGTFRLFDAHTGANSLSTVYMKSPNQPIRYEIRSTGGSGTFNMICSQVSLEGTVNNLQQSTTIDGFQQVTCGAGNATYPILGYRLNSGYLGANITLSDIQSLCGTATDYLVSVQLNPTLSAPGTFSNITNTPVDSALGNGTITVATPGTIIAEFIGSGTSPQVDSFEFKDNILRPGIGIDGYQDEVWICIKTIANNQKYRTVTNLSFFI